MSAITTSQPRALPATTASKVTRGRVAALLADDLDLVAIGPDRELLARGGAEGVGRGQQHLLLGLGQVARQLADAGRLAGAVDARRP